MFILVAIMGLVSLSGDDPSSDTVESVEVKNDAMDIIGLETGDVVSFKGIPYAEAPVGDLRFAPPVAKEPWTETLDCTKYGPCEIQSGSPALVNTTASEDCLYLNVWAPADAKVGDDLPVYVWIHGGAFYRGAGSIPDYDGTHFAEKGIVVVTINYRMGALGFLALDTLMDEYGTTGNWGLLDQIMALQWVNDNIAEFGGDPGNITIGGESAGSVSVSHLVMSPLTEGLFQKAIMQSGNTLSNQGIARVTGATLDGAIDVSQKFAAKFGATDSKEGLEILRSIDPYVLFDLGEFDFDCTNNPAYQFWPTLDGNALPMDPEKALIDGDYNDVEVLMGYNLMEGKTFLFSDSIVNDQNVDAFIYDTFKEDPEKAIAIYEAMDAPTYDKMLDLASLSYFIIPMNIMWDAMVANGTSVYAYQFDYTDSNGAVPEHGVDIGYTFGTLDIKNPNPSETDLMVQEQVHNMWCNFIKSGDPNTGLELPSDVVWEKYSPEEGKVFHFNEECHFSEMDDKELIDELIGYW